MAQNRKTLHKLGITHVLNAAHSKQGSIGDQSFYGNTCVYFGIAAEDSDHYDLSQHFKSAADFIQTGLKSQDGKTNLNIMFPAPLEARVFLKLFACSFTFPMLLCREGVGALHHGCESIGHLGPGLPHDEEASLSERCSETCGPKTSHFPQPELPVSPFTVG